MQQKKPYNTLSIIIPAYNEEGGLADTLDQLLETKKHLALEAVEILVVDDGSTDRTAEIAAQYAGAVVVVTHPVNRGYGAALKTGIRQARHPLILITDADGTYPNERIPELTQRLIDHNYDMVVGARTGQNVTIPLIRRPAKWFIRKLAATIAGQPIADINSGMRVFKRKVALRFFDLLPNGFSFTTTITLGMLTNAYTVDYMPIDYHARIGQSKIKPIRDTLNFIQLILRIALYFEPLKIFIPLSLLLLLLAFVWGVFSIVVLGAFADDSTFLIAIAALQTASLGLLAEMVNQRIPSVYREESESDDD